ncbi:MAG: antA/AntB antirepressor family protein [Solidesulfovibrio sp. DCME]|uniref:antA/AntB antirepressor family protein n=1 Tax=Solidesulfovibrio sp. DCME TaxID=3447380 RepID=UPI003D0E822C
MTGKDVIPVQTGKIGGEEIQTVNARELHTFLEVGKDFSNWIKDRIEEYGFIEGQDFVKISNDSTSPNLANAKSLKKNGWSRDRIDYHLSLDMAKELAMVERNDKGRQARRYFIACEKKLQEVKLSAGAAALARVEGVEKTIQAMREAHEAALGDVRVLSNAVKRLEGLTAVDIPLRRFPYDGGFLHVFLFRERPLLLARDFLRAMGHKGHGGEQSKLKSLRFIRDEEYVVVSLAAMASDYGVSSGFICARAGLSDPKQLSFVTQSGLGRIKDENPALLAWWKRHVLPVLPELFAVVPDKPAWEVRS